MTDVKRPWPLLSIEELGRLPNPEWLIEDHITDGLSVVYGPPGAGKTFLALSWALAIATGSRWFNKTVQPSPVLYVSGEGGGGLSKRVEAWQLSNLSGTPNLYLILGTVQLTNREHVVQLAADIHSTAAKLLVIDTLARSMAGADENSAQDMGLAIQALDWLRRETGCAALIVHHSGVERGRARGSTALMGAVDTQIRVEGTGMSVEVTCDKQKDAARFHKQVFELTPTGSSCVLRESRVPVASGFMPGDFS